MNPSFLEPEWDHSCDEDGYPSLLTEGDDLCNYEETGDAIGDDE